MLLLKNIAPESKGLGAMAMTMVLLVTMTVTATDSSQASDKLGDAKDMGSVQVVTLSDYEDKTSLTDTELKELLTLVGFKGSALKTAWAVAKKESNGRPLAHNKNATTGDNSYGIFQINMLGSLGEDRRKKFSLLTDTDLFNPVKNAQIAFHMTQGGEDWSSWTYLEGERFKQFLLEYPAIFNTKNNKE
jgi:hypothetical protein